MSNKNEAANDDLIQEKMKVRANLLMRTSIKDLLELPETKARLMVAPYFKDLANMERVRFSAEDVIEAWDRVYAALTFDSINPVATITGWTTTEVDTRQYSMNFYAEAYSLRCKRLALPCYTYSSTHSILNETHMCQLANVFILRFSAAAMIRYLIAKNRMEGE